MTGDSIEDMCRSFPSNFEEFIHRVGSTSVRSLMVPGAHHLAHVLVKQEQENPFGSSKDRTALGLLRAVERDHDGPLEIVESTSGNLGITLAGLCRLRGHQFTAVIDPNAQPTNVEIMRHLGARIERVSRADGEGNFLPTRQQRVQELLDTSPRAVTTDQYKSWANPTIHAVTTGPEIHAQAPHATTILVPVSTGGTLVGIASYFSWTAPHVRVIGVDVLGSVAMGGARAGRVLSGIGSSQRSLFMDSNVAIVSNLRHAAGRGCIKVSEQAAIHMCHLVRQRTGEALGPSAGACLWAALQLSDSGDEHLLCVSPDSGERYAHTIYNPHWLRERQLTSGPAYMTDELAG